MTAQDEVACRDLVELVTDYLDDLLEPAVAAAVERHLAECPACVGYVLQMRQTARLLGHLPVETPNDQAKAEILAALHHFRRP
jgi:anti-sigma factor RsiW